VSIYWAIFLLPVLATVLSIRTSGVLQKLIWASWAAVLVVFIGCRFQIGGDWANYLEHYQRIRSDGISAVLITRGIGYGLFNWCIAKLGVGFYGVNILSASILVFGLTRFCWKLPIPWLGFVVSIPYLITVVGMGYTRQSIALGFLLLALGHIENGRYKKFVGLVLAGGLFHESVLVMLGLPLLVARGEIYMYVREELFNKPTSGRSKLIIVLGILGVVALFLAVTYKLVGSFWEFYIVRDQWASSGGKIRSLMNAVPAAILLIGRAKLFPSGPRESEVWRSLSYGAIISIFLVFYFSTAIDRLSIYLLPLQIYVWSHFPLRWRDPALRTFFAIGISAAYALVFYVWLNYAEHAYYWVPYESIF
jgi:hypothetical protein